MRGNRLVWAHNGKDYTETHYIVLNITRYRRYPVPNTPLRAAASQVDSLIEQGVLDSAKALLPQLSVAINADPIITSQEKNLERSWRDYREAVIAQKLAEKGNDKAEVVRQFEAQVRHLRHIRSQFASILYPYEKKDLDFKVSQLKLRAELLSKEGISADPVVLAAKTYTEQAAKLAEAPERNPQEIELAPIDLKKEPPPRLPTWRRVYQKWWFWAIVGPATAGAGAAAFVLLRPKTPGATVPSWQPDFPQGLRVAP
jgi:hypothetical protein